MKKKWNKRNIIIIMIVCAGLLATLSVQRTYAKYKNTYTSSDSATVAKWDINMNQTIDLFKNSYIENGVESVDGKTVIAPGTKGYYKFTISGTAETSYKLNIKVTGEDNVGRIKYWFDDRPISNITLLANRLSSLHKDPKDPEAEINYEHTIRWEWEAGDKSKEDTDKGLEAIIDPNDPNYENQPKVKLNVKITAEQID